MLIKLRRPFLIPYSKALLVVFNYLFICYFFVLLLIHFLSSLQIRTKDLGGTNTTREVTKAVIDHLE